MEVGVEAIVRRRGDDDLADRRRVIEDVAPLAAQRRDVERLRAEQADLLADGEQQLEVDRRALDGAAARDLEDDRDGGLVVGAEDRVAGADPRTVVEHRLDRPGLGDGVEVRAQQDRALALAGDAREQVAALRAGLFGGAVLLDVEAHRPQLARDRLRARALVTERARDRAQPRERLVQAAALGFGGWTHRHAV